MISRWQKVHTSEKSWTVTYSYKWVTEALKKHKHKQTQITPPSIIYKIYISHYWLHNLICWGKMPYALFCLFKITINNVLLWLCLDVTVRTIYIFGQFCMLFLAHLRRRLKVSYCDLSLFVFCRPSVNFFFKRHLLLNHLFKFHITSHECSPWCPLSKLHKLFCSTEQEGGPQSSR